MDAQVTDASSCGQRSMKETIRCTFGEDWDLHPKRWSMPSVGASTDTKETPGQ